VASLDLLRLGTGGCAAVVAFRLRPEPGTRDAFLVDDGPGLWEDSRLSVHSRALSDSLELEILRRRWRMKHENDEVSKSDAR
jgi:hypothetical protein